MADHALRNEAADCPIGTWGSDPTSSGPDRADPSRVPYLT